MLAAVVIFDHWIAREFKQFVLIVLCSRRNHQSVLVFKLIEMRGRKVAGELLRMDTKIAGKRFDVQLQVVNVLRDRLY